MFLIRFFNIGRKWSAKAISEHRFLVKFPTVEVIKELQRSLPNSTKAMPYEWRFSMWDSCARAKANLHSIWVKFTGIPDELLHHECLYTYFGVSAVVFCNFYESNSVLLLPL
jgi:hypothetical protein